MVVESSDLGKISWGHLQMALALVEPKIEKGMAEDWLWPEYAVHWDPRSRLEEYSCHGRK